VHARRKAVWPGWQAAPLLQRAGSCEYLIGHPAPPTPFRPVAGQEVGGHPVFAAPVGTASPAAAATAWEVAGVWTAAIPTKSVFQRILDRQLGRGVVRLGGTAYLRALVHESFHAYVFSVAGGVPTFGATLDEARATDMLGGPAAAARLLAAEGAALREGIAATTLLGARAAATRFLSLRRARRLDARDTAGLRPFEQQLEWLEGLPRYADLRLIMRAGAHDYVPTPGITYPRPAAYLHGFLDGLANPAPGPDGLRGHYQDLGAAEALLLDRLAPEWRGTALRRPRPLDDLLDAAGARSPEPPS
jgi:hypothetical protein